MTKRIKKSKVFQHGKFQTRISALAERLRDVSCLSVVSFDSGAYNTSSTVFLSRVSILTRDIDIANLSVRLSVRSSRSGIVRKRLNVLS